MKDGEESKGRSEESPQADANAGPQTDLSRRSFLQVGAPRDRVPPEDFAFAALRMALDDSSRWAGPALEVYRRAVKEVPALCRGLKPFRIAAEVGCKR